MEGSFYTTLDQLRNMSRSEVEKGRLFERLIKEYLLVDPIYKDRFPDVWLWSEFAANRDDFDGMALGVDLVAKDREGEGYCAIQCKFYAEGSVISKKDVDSFIADSAKDPFTSRIFVETSGEWGRNAYRTLKGVKPSCTVLTSADLAKRQVNWPDLIQGKPEDLTSALKPFKLRPHQIEAITDVKNGLAIHDRGKLIMACGTGKTFTALRIAEDIAGVSKRVLFLVPSITLMQQSMREWAEQKQLKHRYIGVCSDTRVGRTDEDAALEELEIPVTTNNEAISSALQEFHSDALTVVFCTYQSLGLIEESQIRGAPRFNLVICDEAHRTTGVEKPGDKTSPFVLIHNSKRIRAKSRLYMTATPRIYTSSARRKAEKNEIELYSMDDENTYGPEFHRLHFSKAISKNLLSDYKVVVLALSEEAVNRDLELHQSSSTSEINITDSTKILGCWRALQNPENLSSDQLAEGKVLRPLKRAIAFTNTIVSSKRLDGHWDSLVNSARRELPVDDPLRGFSCETSHVDGQQNALNRKKRIEWLKGSSNGKGCRILSNARCLSEGVDVPALDAVLIMNPRKSQVDIVQAVGRVMRKAEGKEFGYIILPVAIPPDMEASAALDKNERFGVVWSVLQALRSHDDRFNVEINQIDLNNNPGERIIFSGIQENPLLPFPPFDIPTADIYAKIVDKCGDRKYWESWANDVADIFSRLVFRIQEMLSQSKNKDLKEWFEAFLEELRETINQSITTDSAIEMMAQHILTQPVFEALFEHYDFAGNNPVSKALDDLRGDFKEFGLENEIRDLEKFYESVRERASGLDNSDARQSVLNELYEKFFKTAMKKDSERLGIVYTPVEIVDFILNSTEHVLQSEFGRSFTDEGVHVLDPFTGTGTFLVRLLQSSLIHPSDLERKFQMELHANEIVLLAYYIAAIHIEEAYHGRLKSDAMYEPFKGIVLTDTFNLHSGHSGFPKNWMPDNSERVEQQQGLPIQVIIGNPPWSVGQKSSADNNPNIDYPEMESRISETYARRATTTLKNSLYDTYKMAIRWASDRIGDKGVIAMVTNGSFIDGRADAGIRACLFEEFDLIYVLNLRGNAWLQGEPRRKERDNVFGKGTRTQVAITILVKNPNSGRGKSCEILYRDIGDYLSQQQKLDALSGAISVAGFDDWQRVAPDNNHDWINQRSEEFQQLIPIGTKETKSNKTNDAVFKLYSNGYKTGLDSYSYSFSYDDCKKNACGMVADYMGALEEWRTQSDNTGELTAVTSKYSKHLRWGRELNLNLKRNRHVSYSKDKIWRVQYRPFVKQFCYVEYTLANCKYQQDQIFPSPKVENRAICVPGIGSKTPFSSLMVDVMPDLGLNSATQCFSRYRYSKNYNDSVNLFNETESFQRTDNITDTALFKFRETYDDESIDKDDIFHYVYGIFHAPKYRDRFSNDLAKELPRIPYANDFYSFAEAGKDLERLHLGYETCAPPLRIEGLNLPFNALSPDHYKLGTRKMKFSDEEAKTELEINEHIVVKGIPVDAHKYQINGRTPLEWIIDRYVISTDKRSGIVNDPNGWFENPKDIIDAIARIVHVSVETVRIIESLPDPFAD